MIEISPVQGTPPHVSTVAPTVTVTAVVADDRPLVRAGLREALSGGDGDTAVADGSVGEVVDLIETVRPDVLVVVLRGQSPDPFRAVATAKALRDDLRVLVLADEVTAADLREAVVAGADGFVLTSAPLAEIRRAVVATARGERVVSSDVAMHLVGVWRPEHDRPQRAALTARETDVLRLLAEGLTNQQIADRLTLSPRTVKTHVQNLLGKLDVPDRTGAVARGFRLGLLR
ncbi:MAG TPA: response regulator transcription factor [Nitriliruptorales bacterium]|nr:response regulator transcription factor [Nitriliruptorales bacterium]